jgi:putative transposase
LTVRFRLLSASRDHRKRTHRPRAINDPKHAHELTFSCYRKHPFLSKEQSTSWLAEQLEVVCRHLQDRLWKYDRDDDTVKPGSSA